MMKDKTKYKHLFPIAVEVEKGKVYKWCACGKSKNPPFCDRENCGDKSITFVADLTETVQFCNCKQTKNPPFCDGTHGRILLDILNKK